MAKGKSSSKTKAANRASSWARGEAKKTARRAAQDAHGRRNKANPVSAPWATAQALRAAKRGTSR